MNNILYSIESPVCKLVEQRLNEHGVQYKKVSNVEQILKLGFKYAPVFYNAQKDQNMTANETLLMLARMEDKQ